MYNYFLMRKKTKDVIALVFVMIFVFYYMFSPYL